MPSADRKWIPPALIAAAALASVAVYGRLPALVDLRFEALLPFAVEDRPSGPAPRSLALFLMPALALILWMAFRLAPTASGQRLARRLFPHAPAEVTSPGQFERFGKTYDTIVLGIVLLIVGLHAAVLAAALQAPAIASRIVPAVLGGSLLLMGNVMPRLRPNWVAGLRSRRVLEDPQLWRSTHRVLGAAFVVSGLLTILSAVVAPSYGVLVGIAAVLVSLVIGFVASRRQGGSVTRSALVAVGLLCASAGGIPAQTRQAGDLTRPREAAEGAEEGQASRCPSGAWWESRMPPAGF